MVRQWRQILSQKIQILESLKKNIQTGDPFLEKLLLEACLEIVENKLVVGMQDMGAGGLLCASLEVVQRGEKNKKTIRM